MTQLHANSINPQTEPLPFGVFFMAPELLKKKKQPKQQQQQTFLVKETKPAIKRSVGTLHEKWMLLHPSIKTNTGGKKK